MNLRATVHAAVHNQLMTAVRSAIDPATDRDIKDSLITDYQLAHQVASRGGWQATIEMLGEEYAP